MSMLSAQCAELREAARSIQGNLGRCLYRRKDVDEMQKVSDLLFEAADTIISLRDRLQAAELGSGTCKLIADLQEDKRTKTGYKLACIHCSACGEQHSGSICFRGDGSYVIYRDEQDIFCRHCGSMITNDVDELSKAVKR